MLGDEQRQQYDESLRERQQGLSERRALAADDRALRQIIHKEHLDVRSDDRAQRGQEFGERQGVAAASLAARTQAANERNQDTINALRERGLDDDLIRTILQVNAAERGQDINAQTARDLQDDDQRENRRIGWRDILGI